MVRVPKSLFGSKLLKAIAAKFPAQVNWTISLNGKQVGHVEGRTPASFGFYSTIGQQVIVSHDEPPEVGKPSAAFAGFLGEPVYRPLVAISDPNYRDPEDWKPTQLSIRMTAAVRREFRNHFPKVMNCSRQDSERAKPWHYADANIVIRKAYSSKRRWSMAEVVLSESECDGPPDEAFTSEWFVITPDQKVHLLGSSMWFVDAGDYDNDGKSELVFSINGNNRGGYKMFYDDFKQNAVFEFGYH